MSTDSKKAEVGLGTLLQLAAGTATISELVQNETTKKNRTAFREEKFLIIASTITIIKDEIAVSKGLNIIFTAKHTSNHICNLILLH